LAETLNKFIPEFEFTATKYSVKYRRKWFNNNLEMELEQGMKDAKYRMGNWLLWMYRRTA
jgi:hypothetical protein